MSEKYAPECDSNNKRSIQSIDRKYGTHRNCEASFTNRRGGARVKAFPNGDKGRIELIHARQRLSID
jgi:hypothetical protein